VTSPLEEKQQKTISIGHTVYKDRWMFNSAWSKKRSSSADNSALSMGLEWLHYTNCFWSSKCIIKSLAEAVRQENIIHIWLKVSH